jgi:hypothetical protein
VEEYLNELNKDLQDRLEWSGKAFISNAELGHEVHRERMPQAMRAAGG